MNMGPPTHQRREHITSTLLGKNDGEIRCPRLIRLGLAFLPEEDPVEAIGKILDEEGYGSPEQLRDVIAIPVRPYLCQPSSRVALCQLASPRGEVLRQALMLGLCTAHLFDPARPVIWTSGSLTRVVDLFDPRGFYA
jgi:hypothetical protein